MSWSTSARRPRCSSQANSAMHSVSASASSAAIVAPCSPRRKRVKPSKYQRSQAVPSSSSRTKLPMYAASDGKRRTCSSSSAGRASSATTASRAAWLTLSSAAASRACSPIRRVTCAVASRTTITSSLPSSIASSWAAISSASRVCSARSMEGSCAFRRGASLGRRNRSASSSTLAFIVRLGVSRAGEHADLEHRGELRDEILAQGAQADVGAGEGALHVEVAGDSDLRCGARYRYRDLEHGAELAILRDADDQLPRRRRRVADVDAQLVAAVGGAVDRRSLVGRHTRFRDARWEDERRAI